MLRRTCLSLVLVTSMLGVSTIASADVDLTLPPTAVEHADTSEAPPRNWGMVIAGLSIFGGVYTANAVAAYAANEGVLAVPVAGPIVFAAQHTDSSSALDRSAAAFLVIDSMAQLTGVTLAVVGAVTHNRSKPRAVGFMPVASQSNVGLMAVGRF
jgi:hypothetical protein